MENLNAMETPIDNILDKFRADCREGRLTAYLFRKNNFGATFLFFDSFSRKLTAVRFQFSGRSAGFDHSIVPVAITTAEIHRLTVEMSPAMDCEYDSIESACYFECNDCRLAENTFPTLPAATADGKTSYLFELFNATSTNFVTND